MTPRQQKGVTLIELMVTVAILGIFASIAAPSFRGLLARDRTTAVANDLLASIQLARSEAVRYNSNARICARNTTNNDLCATSWDNGWIVQADQLNNDGTPDTTTRVRDALPPNITITSTTASVTFGSLGQATASATLTVQHANPAVTRTVCIQSSGRSFITTGSCT